MDALGSAAKQHQAPKTVPGRSPSNIAELFALSRLAPETSSKNVGSSFAGLTAEEAGRRLKLYGLNLVTREHKPTILQELWGRARSPLNALLIALAVASYFLGDVRAAIVITLMVLLAIGTAFIQEHRSNEAAARLRAMVKTTASVRRHSGDGNGDFIEVPLDTLVPGDVCGCPRAT